MFEGREWYGVPGALPGTLDELRKAAPVGIPASYFTLLSFSDGGEGSLPVSPLYFCLDSAEEAIERLRSGGSFERSEADVLFVFGGNGGGRVSRNRSTPKSAVACCYGRYGGRTQERSICRIQF
ncbi:hypothetical protein [Sphingopyxis sp. YF1]|uniref:hypothetical protein n=1 Tax=Sphingopyxis sp. YF1 TaxID=2482763 RepID=UPI001F60FC45|nr:hypothetical protein [Sphingopyxis sp. YF1]